VTPCWRLSDPYVEVRLLIKAIARCSALCFQLSSPLQPGSASSFSRRWTQTYVAARIPLWAWSAGVFGAIFIGLGIFLAPQIGAGTFIALVVTGQMLASITFDHFGWLGLTQRPIDAPRLIGVTRLIGGVVLIRR
jgi:uncharacterized membrane protein YdcZ (DUF606 family)